MSDTTYGFKGELPSRSAFLFEVDGVQIGMFSEISGLEVNIEVATYNEGGENGFVHQLPGRMTWPHIVLKRGVTDSDALFNWVNQTAGTGFATNGNKLTRSTGAITAIGSNGSRLRAWQLQDTFAVRWTGPRFTATGNESLDEELSSLTTASRRRRSEPCPPTSPYRRHRGRTPPPVARRSGSWSASASPGSTPGVSPPAERWAGSPAAQPSSGSWSGAHCPSAGCCSNRPARPARRRRASRSTCPRPLTWWRGGRKRKPRRPPSRRAWRAGARTGGEHLPAARARSVPATPGPAPSRPVPHRPRWQCRPGASPRPSAGGWARRRAREPGLRGSPGA
jgi:phage tail-like protein